MIHSKGCESHSLWQNILGFKWCFMDISRNTKLIIHWSRGWLYVNTQEKMGLLKPRRICLQYFIKISTRKTFSFQIGLSLIANPNQITNQHFVQVWEEANLNLNNKTRRIGAFRFCFILHKSYLKLLLSSLFLDIKQINRFS